MRRKPWASSTRPSPCLLPRIGLHWGRSWGRSRWTRASAAASPGDYRTENLRFNAGRSTAPVAAFDWGLISRGRGSWDFAHFLALSLTPERRRGHQQEIVRKYLQQFPGNRTADHELNKFKDEVRAGLLCLIAKLLFVYADFKGKESTVEMLERSIRWVASAAEDWQATSVLERGWF
mmetsp:Transcript_1089/g.2984  ORF Transcript_1089/g.2984 Transcript_1089/m.2984 type:complete len:177 (-) Transcript_1089:21-551(-)